MKKIASPLPKCRLASYPVSIMRMLGGGLLGSGLADVQITEA